MKKRITAMLLALCMVLSICVPIAVADDEQPEEKAVVPECSCWGASLGLPLSSHGVINNCDRQNFCKEEINTTVSHMVYNWADYPDDVKTYLVELLTGDEAYAEKYAELQKELKLEDNRPQITVEDKSPTVGGYKPSVSVEGQTVRMDKYAKATLSAGADTTWQICIDTTSEIWQWADITGGQGSLTVSYGLVGSLLTEKNGEHTAYLRAYRTYEDGEAQLRAYSKIYTIVMDLSEPDLSESQSLPTPDFEEMTPSDAAPASTEEPAPASTEEPAPASMEEPAPVATETDSAAAGANAVIPASLSETGAETGDVIEPSVTTAEPTFIQPVLAFPQADEQDEQEKFVIVINYVFEDGSQAANSWTASIAKGSSFQQKVSSPAVVGYAPDQAEIDVNETDIQENKTYTVTYWPAEVDFTVKHYQQNIADDQYTLVDTEKKTGLTKSAVGDGLAKSYDGFYKLLYDTTTKIAADGSTVVEIYYDREYYLMNFALGGGYGVEPVYARFGTPVEVGTPTRPGYTFEGWNPDLTENPTTMPAGGITYTAVWKVNETAKVSIVIWGENADDEDYSYIKDSSRVVEMKPGTEFTYSENGTLICALTEHQHTASCYACGHAGTHTRTLACYGLENAAAVDPNNGYGDNDARTHFEDQCDRSGCRGLKQYLKDGAVCQYENGNKDGWSVNYEYFYFLYWGGKYYEITANQYNSWKTNSGRNVTHGRDTYYVYTGKTNVCAHTHTDACANCGIQEHTHDSNCYLSGAGMDKNLWKFVRSDTVTVAPDGSTVVNVFYDRFEKTLTFKYDYNRRSSSYRKTETITAKWGANIAAQYNTVKTKANSNLWSAQASGASPWTGYFGVMPKESKTYYTRDTMGSGYYMYYYGESLTDGDYSIELLRDPVGSGSYITDEDRYAFQGFTYDHGAENGDSCSNAKFYYKRKSYNLTFMNGNTKIKTESVKFEAPLGGYDFTPELPTELYEAGSRHFAGWYLNPECTGAEYKLSEHQMKDDDLILYAKWEKNTYTVRTWLTEDGIGVDAVNVGGTIGETNIQTVEHGDYAKQPVPNPTRDPYKFVGWFYKDTNGEEHAFDFADIPVKQNLDLYAKWSSNTLVKYTIRYVLKDSRYEIAAPTEGSALAGSTKTFNAKAGTELYDQYQRGKYFPLTNSHSLTMDIEEDKNVYIFEYTHVDQVKYTVRYLDKATGEPVVVNGDPTPDKTVDTTDAVITEKFKQIAGYAPDAYQKRLVLSVNEKENVIIFWYTKDTEHAPVQIIHWVQSISAGSYTEYQSSMNVNGTIGETYTVDPLDIPGYTYTANPASPVDGYPAQASGKLTEEGLVLNLYYDRNSYPIELRYLEQGTNKVLAEPYKGEARYGRRLPFPPKNIPGYTPTDSGYQYLTVQIEEGDQAVKNVIIFYYTEQTVNIKYEIVGPDGCGELDNYQESELKAVTGTPKGSTPTAAPGFKFVGWYTTKDCVISVDGVIPGAVDPATNKLTPQKRESGVHYDATYYAKFAYDVFDLTVSKTGAAAIDENQTFIFLISGEGVEMEVVVHGNSRVTVKGLKVGTYTVTELTDWSWRYTPDKAQKTVSQADAQQAAANQTAHTVNFVNERTNSKWLNGAAYCDNRWISKTAINSATVEIN